MEFLVINFDSFVRATSRNKWNRKTLPYNLVRIMIYKYRPSSDFIGGETVWHLERRSWKFLYKSMGTVINIAQKKFQPIWPSSLKDIANSVRENSGRNPDKFTSTRVTENKIEFNWKSLSPIFLFLVLQNHDKNTKRKTNIPPKFRFSARTIVQFRDFNFFHSSCERELKSSCLSLWKISSNF